MVQLDKTLVSRTRRMTLLTLILLFACANAHAAEDPTLHYDMNHWAFRPLTIAQPPRVNGADQSMNAIDHFIRARQNELGLTPSPKAPARKLIRRAYFDLIGMPPTPEQADAFAANPTGKAYRKMVDQLLARPEYGERWARHWLDVARFAESHGFEQDYNRPYAYHYRDFVIRALNQDMPYDQFVQWQIAGDEIAPDNGWANVATGFLGSGVFPTQLTEAEFESARYEALDDMSNTVGVGMLALSMGCARCHDHMYDPVTMDEYYNFTATFATTIRSHANLPLGEDAYLVQKRDFDKELNKLVTQRDQYLQKNLPRLLEPWIKANPVAKRKKVPAEIAAFLDQPMAKWNRQQRDEALAWFATVDTDAKKKTKAVDDLLASKPGPDAVKALIATEGLKPLKHHADGRGFPHFYPNVHFLKRGDVKLKQHVAQQNFPAVLAKAPATRWQTPAPEGARSSHRRHAMAKWITDADGGAGHLLARVIVNRVWQHHFGRGIVTTPDDFGKQGAKPTLPELLDYLASQLIENDWRLKPLHRLIMTSATYRQSVSQNTANEAIDRENQYHWRRERRRLEGEAIRDAMLAISGQLDPTMFGPGSLDESHKRRSIYFFLKRSGLIPMMQTFDAPETLVCQGVRPSTTIAPQSLMMLNNPNVRGYATGLAERVMDESSGDTQAAIQRAYQWTLSRSPSQSEVQDARKFLENQTQGYDSEGKSAASVSPMADLCQVLMCLNEFIYID
jgi:hypothetical protein